MTGNIAAIVFLLLLPLTVVIGSAFLLRRRLARGRRWPLTRGLLRTPGYTLRADLEDTLWEIAGLFLLPALAAALLYSLYLRQAIAGRATIATQVIFLAAVIGVLTFAVWKLRALMSHYRTLKLGYEAEAAAAEDLNRLTHHGYWVFHDVPGGKRFNVDHVVVGPNGVFVVETKGRAKPGREVSGGHEVRSDGRRLVFPTWTETKPIEQAVMNGKWISAWLSSAVGETVRAIPVVLIPGWFVERTSASGVAVLNQKQCEAYFLKVAGRRLSDKQIRSIVHRLEERCREPGRDQ